MFNSMTRRMLNFVPWALVMSRIVCCPLIVAAAAGRWPGTLLGLIVLLALLSDVFDGILARRWDCETSQLRVMDSIADTIFYLGVVGALWLTDRHLLSGNWRLFTALFSLEVFRYVFDLLKYGKTASYHSYLAKCWGLVIAVAVIGVFSFGGLRPLIGVAALLGIVVNLEGLAMSVMLPRWQNDVKTLATAWRLRQSMLSNSAGQKANR